MMKRILGNIVLILLFSINLIANVSIKSDHLRFYPGQTINITITAEGKDIKFPNIDNIAGYNIIGIANSSSTTIINGNITNTKSRTYSIAPQDSFTIPKLKVIVDGKEEYTQPLTIKKVNPATNTHQKGAKYYVELKADKTHIKVGESTTVTVRFKIRSDVNVENVYLTPLKNENFWIKKVGSENRYVDGMYEVIEQKYLLFAQKSGNFKVGPVKATMGFRVRQNIGGAFNDPFFEQFFQTVKYKDIYSNQIKIKVDPLPNGLEVYGDFEIFATVDKKTVHANKPVNLTIKILGEGNIDDIKKFEVNIPDAVVYADEPKVKTYIKDGKYYGEFSQKVAIIADKDFTIPAIKFTYFDKKTNKPITKKTKPIKVKVIGSPISTIQPKVIQSTKQPVVSANTKAPQTKIVYKEKNGVNYLDILIGFIAGILSTLLFFKLDFLQN